MAPIITKAPYDDCGDCRYCSDPSDRIPGCEMTVKKWREMATSLRKVNVANPFVSGETTLMDLFAGQCLEGAIMRNEGDESSAAVEAYRIAEHMILRRQIAMRLLSEELEQDEAYE